MILARHVESKTQMTNVHVPMASINQKKVVARDHLVYIGIYGMMF